MSSTDQKIIHSENISAAAATNSQTSMRKSVANNDASGQLVGSTATEATEYMADYRAILDHYEELKKNNTTSPVMTVFEKSLVLGKRATQIAYGAEPLFDVPARLTKVEEIAEEELRLGKNPFMIKRDLGNSRFEYWAVRDMITSLD